MRVFNYIEFTYFYRKNSFFLGCLNDILNRIIYMFYKG